MKTLKTVLLVAVSALSVGCFADPGEELPWHPEPAGCELPPEQILCGDGVCQAMYHCDHSQRVYTNDFLWCDLSRPEGYLCYWEDRSAQ